MALTTVVLGGAALRLVDLGNRPMHCDEAVHAVKFRGLLQSDVYEYDPSEYHGPSLNYLTLPIAHLASAQTLAKISEVHLRLVPAIFGIVLIGLVWLLRDDLGRPATFCTVVFTAVSPAMVFFSRYYIQEMLLVCFTFGAIIALWRWVRRVQTEAETCEKDSSSASPPLSPSPPLPLLILLGLCIGMMHASKETCVIALFAMGVAAAFTIVKKGTGVFFRNGPSVARHKRPPSPFSVLVVVLVAAGVSALFFSSFLSHPRGVVDSVTTYFHYLGRASGEGSVGRHVYPWDYYLRLLFLWHEEGGPAWPEAPIAAFALVGLIAAALGKGLRDGTSSTGPRPVSAPDNTRAGGPCYSCSRPKVLGTNVAFVRFFGIYTAVMTVVYCAIPYKTPWCALGFLHGMIVLAGVGATVLVRVMPGRVLKGAAVVVLLAAVVHLGRQAYQASFVAYCDENNPYVYSHTTPDILPVVERVEQFASVHPDGRAMHVQVICPNHDYWPLPWYLRDFTRVAFDEAPHGAAAPLIITQPETESLLLTYLYESRPPGQRSLYVPVNPEPEGRDWELRPYVPLRMYVELDLWNAYMATSAETPNP